MNSFDGTEEERAKKSQSQRDEKLDQPNFSDLKENLTKISICKRAEFIVKGMLEHSARVRRIKNSPIQWTCRWILRLSTMDSGQKTKSFNADFETDSIQTFPK